MNFPSGLHLHTIYGDGSSTPEEMILAAIERGFVSVGISEHAYAPYDTGVCIPADKMYAYRDEISALKKKYASKIEVYVGVEVDAFHLHKKSDWDFVIGSVHSVRDDAGQYYTIDYTDELFREAVAGAGGGSIKAMIERYAESVAVLAEEYRPDILGHIDVITKLNQKYGYFDENSGWYLSMWEGLIRRIAAVGCIVELNSGAMSRGYRGTPYPAQPLLEMLRACDVPVTISSDAHAAGDIAHAYPEMLAAARAAGYSSVKIMRGGRFADHAI